MKRISSRTLRAATLAAGLVLAGSVAAQMGSGMMGGGMMGGQQGTGPGMLDRQQPGTGPRGEVRAFGQASGVMRDMAQQMAALSGRLSRGGLDAAGQRQTAEHLRELAGLLDELSAMMSRGMPMDPQTQGDLAQIRQRMNRIAR